MAFVPRTYTQIIVDMIAYVQDSTGITDFTVGSVVRTLLEAAALEDDEQYFQMVQLLDIFSYTTASGEDLDRRLADFNIFRASATASFGTVLFTNSNLTTDSAAIDAPASSTHVQVFDSTGFPPFGDIRVGERTSNAQDLTYLSLDTATNTFTLDAPTTADIVIGSRVSLTSGVSAQVIPSGYAVQAPATATELSKSYTTNETATISVGNYYSNQVGINSDISGSSGNTGAGRITQFVGSPPFSGAGVTNPAALSGGTSRESDQDFRARAVERLQSLSRGTVLALKSYSVGVTDLATGQRVISSNVLEDFSAMPEEVIVYIDDGTGFSPDTVIIPTTTLSADISLNDYTILVADGSAFSTSGYILVGDVFMAKYVFVNGNIITLEEPAPAAVSWLGDPVLVRKVNLIEDSTENGQRRFSLQNFPVVRGSYRIFIKDPGVPTWEQLEDNTDYVLNKGTGEFSIVSLSGLALGTQVVSNYSYYTNLVAETQKVLEGSSGNSVTYPGVKAAGVFLTVEAPVFKRITVRVTLSAEDTFLESTLAPLVKQEIETYISSLKIGEDVITSRIVDVAHDVTGVRSVTIQLPTNNISVLENELPVYFDSNQTSLVTVL